MIWAAYYGYSDIVQALIVARADLNIQDGFGNTALMSAVQGYKHARSEDWNTRDTRDTRYADIIRALIADAAVNFQDEYGRTALIWAAYYGYSDIVQALITAGADLNIQDNYGDTALKLAVWGEQSHTAQLLVDAGADESTLDALQ